MIEIANLSENLSEATENVIYSALITTKKDIKTSDDLKRCIFICPYCEDVKTGDHMVLLKGSLQIKRDKSKFTVSQRMGVCCDECDKNIFPLMETNKK